jgi:hypothetical protein
MKIGQRILLIVLLTWALVMIVPDLWRAAWPLASYGLQVDNEGNVYDAVGQFDREADSPAWQAGIRVGDRLDLDYLECLPYSAKRCGRALSILGGRQLVLPGSSIRLHLLPDADTPERVVTLVAAPEPANPFERFVVGLDQIAGILVVVAAAWLVWTRPGAMSWGFFLYVMWFNPGQVYAYYAMLAESTPLLIAQNVAESFAEATGYAGLILFVLRAPNNKPDPRWRWLERSLPLFALALAIGLLFTYGRFFDFRSEAATRVGILTGFVVAICAVGILLERLRRLPPVDYQRLRWVFWGCLIGLPAFTLAELASSTTIFETRWGDFTPTDDVIGLLYLVNGILCLFVFQAIRRERVVSVAVPLRRVTILGLTLSIPALILHHWVEHMQEHLAIPNWAWLVLGGAALYLISRLHERATYVTDRYFNRDLDRMEKRVGAAILKARDRDEVDRLLSEEPFRALKLTSAASFRAAGDGFQRNGKCRGWDETTAETLAADAPLLSPLREGRPFPVEEEPRRGEPKLPEGLARPVLAVPAANPLRCFALTLYGPHASGADLDIYERAMLGRLGRNAAATYSELETDGLKARIATLEGELSRAAAAPRKRKR